MKTVHIFLGADMRCSHAGLITTAKTQGIEWQRLKSGEALLFINSRKDRLKSLSWNGVLSYVNFSDTRRALDLNAIEEIPKALSPSGHMDYKKALKLALLKRLEKKRYPVLELVG